MDPEIQLAVALGMTVANVAVLVPILLQGACGVRLAILWLILAFSNLLLSLLWQANLPFVHWVLLLAPVLAAIGWKFHLEHAEDRGANIGNWIPTLLPLLIVVPCGLGWLARSNWLGEVVGVNNMGSDGLFLGLASLVSFGVQLVWQRVSNNIP